MKTTNFGVRLMAENIDCIATPLPGITYIGELIKCILNAKYSIDIIQYSWNFYPERTTCDIQKLNRSIIGKSQDGVKIRVLLNKEAGEGHLRMINMKASRFLTEAGISVKTGRSNPIIHSKLFIFDDDIVILGSHNLSNRSVSVNVETSILIKSRTISNEYKRYFNTLWNLL